MLSLFKQIEGKTLYQQKYYELYCVTRSVVVWNESYNSEVCLYFSNLALFQHPTKRPQSAATVSSHPGLSLPKSCGQSQLSKWSPQRDRLHTQRSE